MKDVFLNALVVVGFIGAALSYLWQRRRSARRVLHPER